MFMGYSTTYQMFAGAMEVVAGLLLLNRKTVTLGLLVASGVFANVLAMNLSYDIPVKIFSGHLLFYCIYLLAHDWQRLFKAFVLNEPSIPTNLYAFNYSSKKMRVGRIIAKLLFIGIALLYQFYSVMEYAHSSLTQVELKPVKPGIYDVKTFVLNHDTIPALASDSLRWKDIVFDYGGQGSVNSTDTLFRQRYRRGYFVYKPDTTAKSISILRRDVTGAEKPLFAARYELTAGNGMKLWAKVRSDSVYVELALSKRRFQLAERQFHWLSEYNR